MASRGILVAASVIAVVLTAGCGSTIFKTFDTGNGKSISLDAKQRVVLVGERLEPDGTARRVICAEPSPDALVALGASVAGELSASGPLSGGAASGSAKLAGDLSESAAAIGPRTATIQLLRDGLYRSCEAYMNGAIDAFQYNLILSHYDRAMVTLLAIENLTQAPPAPAVALTAGTQAASGAGASAGGATITPAATGPAPGPGVAQAVQTMVLDFQKRPPMPAICMAWYLSPRLTQVSPETRARIDRLCAGALVAPAVP